MLVARVPNVEGDRRQLAAVMLTDMVGYSSLAQRDERLALELVREQEEIVRAIVAPHGGSVVKSTGDGQLVIFDSALDAVRCAIEVQEFMMRRNGERVEDRITLRIGVHLGDVVHRGGDVFGDAVNIVARIEPLADHGGVGLTQQVFDQVHNKLEVALEPVATPKLKNIDDPIQLYRVVLSSSGHSVPGDTPQPTSDTMRRIVVLPFTNISPDPRDEYFADGMTEELIERLAHVSGLSVIARTTAMHYKNSQETALEIGRALRSGLVLECSVRKAGTRIRITAQLVDTGSEEHLWASHYDRELDDIFAIQDDIASQIVTAISAQLAPRRGPALEMNSPQRDTTDIAAYTDFLHGRKILREKQSEATIRHALAFFERAVARDPEFARARVGIAEVCEWLSAEGSEPFDSAYARSRDELERALATDPTLAEAHSVLAGLMLGSDEIQGSKREALLAIRLNPNLADPYRWLAQVECGDGNVNESTRLLEQAYAIDPLDVNVIAFLGRCYFYSGRIADALEHWDRCEPLIPFRINAQRAEFYLSRHDDAALERCLDVMRRTRPGNIWILLFEGIQGAARGDEGTARRSIDALDALAAEGHMTGLYSGFVHYALGEIDDFFASMYAALEMHQLPLLELMYSPLYDDVRGDPRFADLMLRQREQSS